MSTASDRAPRGAPHLSARTVLSRGQIIGVVLLLASLGFALYTDARQTFLWVNTAFIALYLVFSHYKLVLQFLSLGEGRAEEVGVQDAETDWPRYTILAPVYSEAGVVAGLVEHLKRLDYPADRLQILCLVEEDDSETRAALERCRLTPPFEVLVVSVSIPRTKPKACNYGLEFATGDLLVIYDAEDRPEPDQLKKAAVGFARAPQDVICLQARLDFYNPHANLITKLFTTEYACWFGFCLPGLHVLDAPIPLGGTSNHLRMSALRALGGWDPFNVTEDCDLGMRLYIHGYRTEPLDSTTWEEAASRMPVWIRQRSRWFKGYLQTYLVYLRQQDALAQRGGLHSLLHFHMIFGANCFCLLMNPFYWALTAVWFTTRLELVSSFYPLWVLIPALVAFLAGNGAFVLSAMLACVQGRRYRLLPYCLLTPIYWVFMSVGAWKGALQLLTRPFHWEKTPHGYAAAQETGT